MKNTAAKIILLAAILGAGICGASAQERMIFLHLKKKGEAISLVSATTVDGRLKPAPAGGGDIRCDILATNGATLWQTSLADPCERRFETADPAAHGKFKQHAAHAAEAEFTLRVPKLAGAEKIDFYREENSGDKKPKKKILASLTLP